jgi:oligoendopeptidase F
MTSKPADDPQRQSQPGQPPAAEIPGWSGTHYDLAPWDLSQLADDEQALEDELAVLVAATGEFEKARHLLKPTITPAEFLSIVRSYEDLVLRMGRLSTYANLWLSADLRSAAAAAFRQRGLLALSQVKQRILGLGLWWQSLPPEEAERLLPAPGRHPRAADFRHYLCELRRLTPHTLDASRERLVSSKNAHGVQSLLTLYSILTSRLLFEPEVAEQSQTLNEAALRGCFSSPDRALRAAAYGELLQGYGREAAPLTQIYLSRVRDWHGEYVQLRGYASPIAMRNAQNDLSDDAVQNLLDVVHRNAPIFQRYFALKGRWLGIERLSRQDLYAPLTASDRTYSYGEAVEHTLAAFDDFDPQFAHLAERVFAEKHIDGAVREGKRTEAQCAAAAPGLTPWVQVSHAGRLRDVTTLAHEMGHAVHAMLSHRRSILTHQPSLPLAETASTFAEMLVMERLRRREDDPLARRELLAAALDEIYTTSVRQTFFVRFEMAAHRAVGANASGDDLHQLYLENLHEQFADSVEVPEEFRFEWLSVPHLFHTPFYCYAYSFGQLLALALFRRYQNDGARFCPGYLRLLGRGGSAPLDEILREVDVSPTDPDFWQGSFDVVAALVDELEASSAT